MEIKLQGKTDKVTLIDDEDFELVSQYKWYLNSTGYAATSYHIKGKGRKDQNRNANLRLHRLILGVTDSKVIVDHINRNRLDNRKENLRIVTKKENAWNSKPIGSSSGYVGVFYSEKDDSYTVYASDRYYGIYKCKELAALVYDKVVRAQRGDYAVLNFPDGPVLPDDFLIVNLNTEPKRAARQSQYPGVSWIGSSQKRVKRWRAVHKKKTIGYFYTELEAYEALQEYKNAC